MQVVGMRAATETVETQDSDAAGMEYVLYRDHATKRRNQGLAHRLMGNGGRVSLQINVGMR